LNGTDVGAVTRVAFTTGPPGVRCEGDKSGLNG
jgi:hypothetical protein